MTIWHTDTIKVQTPRGVRYQGLAASGDHRVEGRHDVRYRSRLRIHEGDAYGDARRRVVHHNLWHDGTLGARSIAALHRSADCHEQEGA